MMSDISPARKKGPLNMLDRPLLNFAFCIDFSNGFVEGTNSRLKMIKRTMYGRYGRQLLEAKLRYMGYNNNNG